MIKFNNIDVKYMESNYNGEDKEIINIRQSDNVIGYLLASIIRSYYCFRIEHDVAFISKLNLLSLICIIISKINKKNIIVDWDDLDSEFQINVFRKYLTIFVEYFFPRFIPVITTHNNSISVYAKSRKANSVFFIPQIIDLDLFDPFKYDRNKIKVDLGLKDYKVLVYLGSLNEGGRDLEIIINKFKNISLLDKNIKLIIIGEGLLKNKFISMVTKMKINNVIFMGSVLHEKVPEILASGDIALIYMSETKGNKMRVSLKMIEYLAMNMKVVGVLEGNTKDIFKNYCIQCNKNLDNYEDIIFNKLYNNHFHNIDSRKLISDCFNINKYINDIKCIIEYSNSLN